MLVYFHVGFVQNHVLCFDFVDLLQIFTDLLQGFASGYFVQVKRPFLFAFLASYFNLNYTWITIEGAILETCIWSVLLRQFAFKMMYLS